MGASQSSPSEQNKQIARSLWDAAKSRDFAKMETLYDANVIYHGPAGEERKGRSSTIDVAREYLGAFPDMQIQVEQIVADYDIVVSRVQVSGTHKGELKGIPPTGKKLDIKWIMDMVRIQNGRVVEEWEIYDQFDIMKQLGLAG